MVLTEVLSLEVGLEVGVGEERRLLEVLIHAINRFVFLRQLMGGFVLVRVFNLVLPMSSVGVIKCLRRVEVVRGRHERYLGRHVLLRQEGMVGCLLNRRSYKASGRGLEHTELGILMEWYLIAFTGNSMEQGRALDTVRSPLFLP